MSDAGLTPDMTIDQTKLAIRIMLQANSFAMLHQELVRESNELGALIVSGCGDEAKLTERVEKIEDLIRHHKRRMTYLTKEL